MPLRHTGSQIIAFLLALALSVTVTARDERNEQIQFAKGSNGATINSSITGYESVNYRLTAKAGQMMTVKLSTGHNATYFNIYAPGKEPGDAAMYIGSIEGPRFHGKLPADGTYVILVYMMRSAARRNETADYKLDLEIDSQTHSAVTPGTKDEAQARVYNASGILPCSAGEPSFRRDCPFQVKRHPGGATIWARKPLSEKGERVLFFQNNRFTSDDDSPLNWQRQGDNWWLAAGGQEYYLIPDAVIYGG